MGWGAGSSPLARAHLGKEGRRRGVQGGLSALAPLPCAACGSSHCSLCAGPAEITSPGARPSKALAELVVCTGNLGETRKLGFGEDKVVGYGEGVAERPWRTGWERTANGESERRLLEWRTHRCYPPPHRARVSSSCWEPWREWHVGVARRGHPQPPLSLAAAAAPNPSSPASSLSRVDLS